MKFYSMAAASARSSHSGRSELKAKSTEHSIAKSYSATLSTLQILVWAAQQRVTQDEHVLPGNKRIVDRGRNQPDVVHDFGLLDSDRI